jgi:hypothetical protein
MIVVELEEKEYRLPSGWHEVSVGCFEEIVRLSGLFPEYNSNVAYTLDLFAALTGAPIESLKKMTRASFDILSEKIKWVNEEMMPSNKWEFEIEGEKWVALKNLDTLEMGDAINLELVIKDSNESNILSNILPLLIRKEVDGKIGDFDSENYELNKKLIKDNLMVPDVIGLKSFF